LDAAGYDVHTAKIGAEAVRRIFDPRPDVVILDINMPEFDRAQRSKALHEEPPGRASNEVAETRHLARCQKL
jgi:CheY-like chemotaxis protein